MPRVGCMLLLRQSVGRGAPQTIIALLGRKPWGSTGDYQVCGVCVSSWSLWGGWADVRLWVAVCFLAKISPKGLKQCLHACHSQRQSRSHFAFLSFSDQWEIRTSFTLFHFSKIFYTKWPFSFPRWSKDLLVENRSAGGGQSTSKSTCVVPAWTLTAFGDRPASSMSKFSASVNSDLGNGSFWVEIRDAEHVDRCSRKYTRVWSYQLTTDLRDIYFFGYPCNGRVWKQFRCLRLS